MKKKKSNERLATIAIFDLDMNQIGNAVLKECPQIDGARFYITGIQKDNESPTIEISGEIRI